MRVEENLHSSAKWLVFSWPTLSSFRHLFYFFAPFTLKSLILLPTTSLLESLLEVITHKGFVFENTHIFSVGP